ncbi:MAG: fused MFS/spermidine synthase [Betaproteobacteria bacterium]|nr:fused MFS/spermidine synthase [Betaproteobacteria bacterium]
MIRTRTPKRIGLYFVAFFSGLGTMAFEMVLGRALVPYFGGTVYTWGALIAVFLLGMSLGFYAGGRFADRFPRAVHIGVIFFACGILILLTPLFLEQVALALIEEVEDVRYGALTASIVFAFAPALLYAATSPLAVRLALVDMEHSGSVVGTMSALNTVGSIVGTIGTSFLLIPALGSKAIFALLGGLTMATGVATSVIATLYRRKSLTSLSPLAVSFAIGAAVLATAPGTGHAADVRANPLLLREGVVEAVESEYNNIFVIRRGNLLYMNFGYRGSHYVESVYDTKDPAALPATYTRYMVLGTLYPETVERAAFVGLGGGRTASYLIRHFPGLKLEVAELDPEVIRLAKKHFAVQESDRLRIIPEDGRVFLTRSRQKYDIVFLDAYRGPFVPFHLLTREFFELIKKKLKPGGVVVQNVEPTTMLLDSAITTIGAVFRNLDTYEAGGNVVVVAYDGARIPDARLRQKAKLLASRQQFRYDLNKLLDAKASIAVARGAKVLTDDFAPVEMLHTIKRHNEKRS